MVESTTYLKGIDQNFLKDAVFGIIAGIAFIFINILAPTIAIGVPTALAFYGVSVFAIIIAPVAEEFVFRGVVPALLQRISPAKVFLFSAVISAIIFGFFHYFVYGLANIQAISAPLIGAIIFGLAMAYLVKYTNSLLPAIIAHMIFNAWILRSSYLAIGIPAT